MVPMTLPAPAGPKVLTRVCPECNGSGRHYWSKYGGNDPDVVDRGPCINERCEGGDIPLRCEAWRCDQPATELHEGEPYCATHAEEYRCETEADRVERAETVFDVVMGSMFNVERR